MHVSFFFPVLQYLWRKNLVLSIFQWVKFRDMNSRNPGLQIFIYKQYKSITLFAWSMGWYTSLQGDVEGAAAEVLWLQPFGCKVFASKAVVQAWLLWEPLSVTWLRMWLGCKAAQGLDFHDYLLKIKTGLIEHFGHISQRGQHPVVLGIGSGSCWTCFHTIPIQMHGVCGSDSRPALLPLLAASTPNPSFPSLCKHSCEDQQVCDRAFGFPR